MIINKEEPSIIMNEKKYEESNLQINNNQNQISKENLFLFYLISNILYTLLLLSLLFITSLDFFLKMKIGNENNYYIIFEFVLSLLFLLVVSIYNYYYFYDLYSKSYFD
jgi:hypothetical protein